MNREETKKILMAIKAIYQNFEFSEVQLELWPMILGDATYDEVHRALLKYMRKSEAFAPVPGKLRDMIGTDRFSRGVNPPQLPGPRAAIDLSPLHEGAKKARARDLLDDDGLNALLKLTGGK